MIEGRRERRTVLGLLALAAALVAALALSPLAEAKRGDLKVALKSAAQGKLVSSGKVKVTARSRERRRAVLTAFAHQAGEKRRLTKHPTIKVGPDRKVTAVLRLTERGNGAVQSCIPTKLDVVAKSKGGKKLGRARMKMKRDPAVCDGDRPGRRRPRRPPIAATSICRAGRAVPVPVPERLLHPPGLRAPTPACG